MGRPPVCQETLVQEPAGDQAEPPTARGTRPAHPGFCTASLQTVGELASAAKAPQSSVLRYDSPQTRTQINWGGNSHLINVIFQPEQDKSVCVYVFFIVNHILQFLL